MRSGETLSAVSISGGGLFTPLTALLLVVIAAFLLCLIAGVDNDTVADFFIADRSLSATRNALALCGDYISITALLTAIATVAVGGYDGLVLDLCAVAGLGVLLLLAEPLRNLGRFTLGGILESRVSGTASRVAGTVITLAVCLPLVVVQLTVAGDATAYVLGVDGAGAAQACTALLGVLIVSFTAFGGMRGNSMIQIGKVGLVFATAVTLSCVALSRSGWDLGTLVDTAAAHSRAKDSFYEPGLLFGHGTKGGLDFVSLCVSLVLGSAALPHIVMRVSASRNGPAARQATRFAVVVAAVFYAAMAITGLSAVATVGVRALTADDPQGNTALFLLADALTGSGGGVLFTVVACAAFITALTTVAGGTLAAAASLAHDLYAHVARRGVGAEQREVSAARVSVMVFGLVSVYMSVALHQWSILPLSTFAITLAASAALPAVAYSLFWQGFTRAGLLWTVYGSLASCVLLQVFGPTVSGGGPLSLFPQWDFHWFPLENIGLATIPLGFLLGWAGSLLSRRSPAQRQRYAETRTALLIGRDGTHSG
ncbi:sodium/solute symporter [Streptomyces griseorubiginosus]|uniref:sodium/solute symporter n=1 Tax=Streptomyces griseorubiginosus TaxID=67304 RepID=UPI0036A5AE63